MHSPTSRGFTLIEMVVIVGLLGLIMMIAAPPMGRFISSSRLAGASSMLAGDLRYARSLATSQGRNYELQGTTGGYRVVCLAPSSTLLSRTLQSGITFAVPETTRFFAWGLTESAVWTLQKQGRSRIVRLTATGQVTHD